MKITVLNFGHFTEKTFFLRSCKESNGWGKTTLLNAYYFAITGRTIGGFEPRRIGSTPDNNTFVHIDSFNGVQITRYAKHNGGTEIYVSGLMTSQIEFERLMLEQGVDIQFAAMCADVNILTSSSLTSEDLRKLLVATNVMDNGETAVLRKEAEAVRKKKKEAEKYALSNVSLPMYTVEPITLSDSIFLQTFNEQKRLSEVDTKQQRCEHCGSAYDSDKIRDIKQSAKAGLSFVLEHQGEYNRINAKRLEYQKQTQDIETAQRLIDAASKARADVVTYDKRLSEIDAEIREIEAKDIRAELPDGVELVTEQTAKTGTTKSVCTLTYNGVPLKSVNRAKRIEICVRLLDQARSTKGMDIASPIIVDNAESVLGLDDVPNLIRLSVG